jgi:hypothetical protein
MSELKDWTIHYIKQKNSVKGDLVKMAEHPNKIVCEYKDHHAEFYFQENLALDVIKSVGDKEVCFFICTCNEHNFKLLVDNWDLLKTRSGFTFIFLNPGLAEKWIIKPHIHAKVADPATLKQGLRTMYETCLGRGD